MFLYFIHIGISNTVTWINFAKSSQIHLLLKFACPKIISISGNIISIRKILFAHIYTTIKIASFIYLVGNIGWPYQLRIVFRMQWFLIELKFNTSITVTFLKTRYTQHSIPSTLQQSVYLYLHFFPFFFNKIKQYVK